MKQKKRVSHLSETKEERKSPKLTRKNDSLCKHKAYRCLFREKFLLTMVKFKLSKALSLHYIQLTDNPPLIIMFCCEASCCHLNIEFASTSSDIAQDYPIHVLKPVECTEPCLSPFNYDALQAGQSKWEQEWGEVTVRPEIKRSKIGPVKPSLDIFVN